MLNLEYRRQFLHYPLDDLTLAEWLDQVDRWVRQRKPTQISVLNANKMYLMDRLPELAEAIHHSSGIIPENAVYFGCKWLGQPLKEKDLGGITLMEALLAGSHQQDYRFYFLGSTPAVLQKLQERCRQDYPHLNATGWHDGYFTVAETPRIIQEINATQPDILFVALGSPKQELWIYRHLNRLQVPVCLGVGGSFEVVAGLKKAAPKWTKNGLEWLYRSIQDPKKFKRYAVINTYFIYQFLKYRWCLRG